ncbi:M61 family metallopeptidase [Alteromonas gracilis]|uniref:M61 family metallopeptidase n=1 Tax=Alteromonas gracilis TaxID=1479524 RepID=UPI0030D3E246
MGTQTLQYTLTLSNWRANEFSVSLFIPKHDKNELLLTLPSWIPGSYMVRDFAKSIITLSAVSDGDNSTLPIEKIDKQSWKVKTSGNPCSVSYTVYANDLSIRSAFINDEYAFINGTSAFLSVEGMRDVGCTLEVRVPTDDPHLSAWQAYTSMPKSTDTSPLDDTVYRVFHSWHYACECYGDIIDHPIYIGLADTHTFEVDGVTFTLLFSGNNDIDYQRIANDLIPICRHHLTLFPSPHPISDYLFMTLLADNGFGGLEHKYSTALLYPRYDLPLIGDPEDKSDGYITFLSLCSHEFFHTWHVKRIKPDVMVEPDLSQETYTNQLWIYEGFTSFYDDVALARSGVIDAKKYLNIVSQNISRLLQNAGRFKQSAAQSSFDAWTKFYKQDASATNNIVSYYTKGGIIALGLDLLLRKQSDNKFNLDSLMKLLWTQYGKDESGTPDDVVQYLCKTHFDIDVSQYLDSVVYGTDDVDLSSLLSMMGVELKTRPRVNAEDKGGVSSHRPIKHQLGATTKAASLGLTVVQVFEGLAAQQAGVLINDLIVALDGHVVNPAKLQRLLDCCKKESIALTLIRDGRLLNVTLPILPARCDMAYFDVVDDAVLTQWLA